MANALAKVGDEFQPLVPPRGSVAASVQAVLPQSQVAAAFHHLPARELADIDHPIDSGVQLLGVPPRCGLPRRHEPDPSGGVRLVSGAGDQAKVLTHQRVTSRTGAGCTREAASRSSARTNGERRHRRDGPRCPVNIRAAPSS